MNGSVSADPRIGSELAGYRIERLLGRGGMSVVYLAHHERLDRPVALKLMAPELSADEGFRERFLRESRLAASLDHPNVLPVYDADEADGVMFIAMRYVRGTDLGRLLKAGEPVPLSRSLAILDRVAGALDAAHARGLVHRDVKPENVLLADGEDEHVYLSDFGLTMRLGDEHELDGDGSQLLGSLDYLAPELIEDGPVSAQTDVYSLGCVLFRCLTGEAPFRAGRNRLAALWAHLEGPPPKPSERAAELPEAIDRVIARALAKDPSERHESCAALLTDARSALGLPHETGAAAPRRRRRRLLPAIALALAAAAAVASVLLLTGDEQPAVGDDWTRIAHSESVFGGGRVVVATGLASNDEGLVAVGVDGDVGDSEAAVWVSRDSLSWERIRNAGLTRANGEGVQGMFSVAFGSSRYVAVGASGLETQRSADPSPDLSGGSSYDENGHLLAEAAVPLVDLDAAVWTSADGRVWTPVPHDEAIFGDEYANADGDGSLDDGFLPSQWMSDVTSGGPGHVAVGLDVERAAVWTSPDGVRWSRVPRESEVFESQAKAGLRFASMWGVTAPAGGRPLVAVGADQSSGGSAAVVWLSPDGLAWRRVGHDDAAFGNRSSYVYMMDVAAGGPGFVAVGFESNVNPVSQLLPIDVLHNSDLPYSSVAEFRGAVWTSPDGEDWTRVSERLLPEAGGEKVFLRAVATGGPGLVAVGWRVRDSDVDPVVWTSTDGRIWHVASDEEQILHAEGGQFLAGVIAGGPGLVAVGSDGSAQSTAAAVWTSP